MTMEDYFNKEIFIMRPEDLLIGMNQIIDEISPEGKTGEDFTGGYVQQLKNSTQFVAYFGTKAGEKNRATSKLTIQNNEIDEMYMMLKIKIQDMRTSGSKVISLTARRLARAKEEQDEKSRIIGGFLK